MYNIYGKNIYIDRTRQRI